MAESLGAARRIAHISDLHFSASVRTLEGPPYFVDRQHSRVRADALARFLVGDGRPPAPVVVITGDLTDSGDDADYAIARAFKVRLEKAGVQVLAVPGNHDLCWEGVIWPNAEEAVVKRRAAWASRISDTPYPAVVDGAYGRIVLLDSMQGELADWSRSSHWSQGRLGEAQLEALRAIVDGYQDEREQGLRLLVCLHHSPFDQSDKTRLEDAERFLEIVGAAEPEASRVDGLLFGHVSQHPHLWETFPDREQALRIGVCNCENLEHGDWEGESVLAPCACWMAAATRPDGRIVLAFVAPDGRVRVREQLADGAWSPPAALGEARALQVTLARARDGRLAVALLGADGRVHAALETSPGTWQPLVPLDGLWAGERLMPRRPQLEEEMQSLVAVAEHGDGRLEVLYAGPGLRLCANRQVAPGAAAFGPQQLLTGSVTDLCVVQRERVAEPVLLSISRDARLERRDVDQVSGTWGAPAAVGGEAVQLSALCDALDRIALVYVGTNGRLYRNGEDASGRWTGEARLEGSAHQVSLARNRDGRLEAVYLGTNAVVYHDWQLADRASWSGEESIFGFDRRGQQLCTASDRAGRLNAFYLGVNGRLYGIRQVHANSAYPVTILDLETLDRQVCWSDGSAPTRVEPYA